MSFLSLLAFFSAISEGSSLHHETLFRPLGPYGVTALEKNSANRFQGWGKRHDLFVTYRWIKSGHTERKCLLVPTCSKFAVDAVEKKGPIKGVLMGLARAQMLHDSQDGFLMPVGFDGDQELYADPVENWEWSSHE